MDQNGDGGSGGEGWLKVGHGWGGWGCTGTGYVGVKVVMLHHRLQLQAWGMGLVMSPVMVACMEG